MKLTDNQNSAEFCQRNIAAKMKLVFIGMGAVGRAVLEVLPLCGLVPEKYWKNIFIRYTLNS